MGASKCELFSASDHKFNISSDVHQIVPESITVEKKLRNFTDYGSGLFCQLSYYDDIFWHNSTKADFSTWFLIRYL